MDDQLCLIRKSTHSAAAGEIVFTQGTTLDYVFAVCQGWALRFVRLADGRRQNLGVLLPGDLWLSALFQDSLYFAVEAVTALRVTRFARADVTNRIFRDANMLELFGRACAAEQRDVDQRAVDLGRRSAQERVAHLLLSLVERASGHAARPNYGYAFPLLQRHIADFTGLTPVHVSRVMTEFRKAGLMKVSQGFLTISDLVNVELIARISTPRMHLARRPCTRGSRTTR
jgi:CRP/FNR family transcriptional regulator, anaerobic regulatory protein